MIYNKIYDFCKVKNVGNCFSNGDEPTPRVKFLMNLLDSEGIKYELDVFKHKRGGSFYKNDEGINFYNIILRGTSNKMVVAHHDINNPNSDNANDNSCSVINIIALKKLRPSINVVLLDGEEFGGIGSEHLSKRINKGDFGNIEWVLNVELSGKGGKYFFIGNYPGKLSDKIVSLFNCPIVSTPFNDSVILRGNGIDSVVINPLPPTKDNEESRVLFPDGTYLDFSILFNCHKPTDGVDKISPDDMKEFVEEVLVKIID